MAGFFSDTFSNIKAGLGGMVKGIVALGIIGAIGGALVIGGLGVAAGGGIAQIATLAGLGAIGGGIKFAGIGALVGAVMGVMQNREQHGSDAQDVTNIANMAFAQGMAAGRNKDVSEHSKEEVKTAADHFQKQLAAEKSGVTMLAR
jgi:hypothetical protein